MRSSLLTQSVVVGVGKGLTSKCSPLRSRGVQTWPKTRTSSWKTKTTIPSLGRCFKDAKSQRKQSTTCRSSVDPIDRALGSAPYLLPLLDGLKYGTIHSFLLSLLTEIRDLYFQLLSCLCTIAGSCVSTL